MARLGMLVACTSYVPLEAFSAQILSPACARGNVAVHPQGILAALPWCAPHPVQVPAAVPAAMSSTAPKLSHCMACEARACDKDMGWQDGTADFSYFIYK